VQAYFQVEILARRVPLDEAFQNGDIPKKYEDKLRIIRQIKEFGSQIDLNSTQNYDTIALGWKRTIWNVSASQPDQFKPMRWWFPITGSVPYLGYFREHDARRMEQALSKSGLDVYVRTAGAYSTLGWFRDPILPKMLNWSEFALASTLLHELAHATLWIPGSIKFNESFANIVGEQAGLQYLQQTYGTPSPELTTALEHLEDRANYREVLHTTYKNLDTLYARDDLSRSEVTNRKRAIIETLPQQIALGGFHQKKRYLKAADPSNWNNARLMQFKTYNASSDWFRIVLKGCNNQLSCFIDTIEEITQGSDDPFSELEAFAVPLEEDPGDIGP
jgi:predicted aminopeptidase